MTSTVLDIEKDKNSTPAFITVFSAERASILLSVSTDATIPVPSDARFAICYYDTGKDVFVSDAIIVLPVGATPVTTAGVLLKPSIDVTNVTTLHFFCDEVAFVSVEFYR